MIGPSTTSRFLGKIIFSKEEIQSLSKIRIIKKNLVHVHGFPQSISSTDKLSQIEYFGQYGKIEKILLSSKINSETNKKTFSVYITYSNEKEASYAILAVDSLLIEGKLIRVFFGTTKYCNYFLNNSFCPNEEKCMFLHKLVNDKDVIIDSNTIFSYNEHINLAKKIIQFSNPETKKKILSLPMPKNTVFPNIGFIFLNEDQKEHYFHSNAISYVKSNSNIKEINKNFNNFFSDNIYVNTIKKDFQNNNFENKIYQNILKNNSIVSSAQNNKSNNIQVNNSNNLISKDNCYKVINYDDPFEMHKLLQNHIRYILALNTIIFNKSNKLLKKIEFNYLKKELGKKGINIYKFLNGCLDYIKDCNYNY